MQGEVTTAPRALLVDLDQTLVDHSGVAASVAWTCEVVAAAVPGLDPARLRQANTEFWAEHWPRVEKECWLGRMDGFAIRREGWRRALAACGCADESVVELAVECLQTLSHQARRLYPDAEQFLAGVAKAGTRLAVVTNGPSDFQHETLRGIEDRVDAVIISGEVGVAKPDPAIFLLATERLGVTPSDAWHVGDSLTHDVVGAQAAGMPVAWLNRGRVGVPLAISSASIVAPSSSFDARSEAVRPDLEISSLTELLPILSK